MVHWCPRRRGIRTAHGFKSTLRGEGVEPPGGSNLAENVARACVGPQEVRIAGNGRTSTDRAALTKLLGTTIRSNFLRDESPPPGNGALASRGGGPRIRSAGIEPYSPSLAYVHHGPFARGAMDGSLGLCTPGPSPRNEAEDRSQNRMGYDLEITPVETPEKGHPCCSCTTAFRPRDFASANSRSNASTGIAASGWRLAAFAIVSRTTFVPRTSPVIVSSRNDGLVQVSETSRESEYLRWTPSSSSTNVAGRDVRGVR